MTQHTLLVAGADHGQRTYLARQLDGDGHTVYEADRTAALLARLSCHPVDVLILGELEQPSEATALVRSMRAASHQRIHPGLSVITLGAGDELTTLRAYESGSDHHLPVGTVYVLLRAVISSVVRRVLEETAVRPLCAGAIDVDLIAKTVTVAGTPVHVSRLEFELLVKFAGEPTRLFSKHELARCIWRGRQISQRTVDSHIAPRPLAPHRRRRRARAHQPLGPGLGAHQLPLTAPRTAQETDVSPSPDNTHHDRPSGTPRTTPDEG